MGRKILIFILALALFVGGGFFFYRKQNSGPNLDAFVQCLKDKKVIFYGAYWCPHCQNQKKLFGSSAKNLPYVECSNPAGTGQTKECDDKQIKGYPTWEFPDGSRVSGEMTLSDLSAKSGCSLPQ